MKKNTLWPILGVITAVVIVVWLVGAVFSVLWFIAKIGIVVIVAVAVFILLRADRTHVPPSRRTQDFGGSSGSSGPWFHARIAGCSRS